MNKKWIFLSLILMPTLICTAGGKENEAPLFYEEGSIGEHEGSSLFDVDPYQRSVEPSCRVWQLQQMIKNSKREKANELASAIGLKDNERIEAIVEKDPSIVNTKDSRGYYPVFTAIDHCLMSYAESFFYDMENKNPQCQGKTLVEFTQKHYERTSYVDTKEGYLSLMRFFKNHVVVKKEMPKQQEKENKREPKSPIKDKKSNSPASKSKRKEKKKSSPDRFTSKRSLYPDA